MTSLPIALEGAVHVAPAPVAAGERLHALDSLRAVGTAVKFTVLAASALYAWCMTFAVTGLFLRMAGGHRPWVRYLADASYWWYLWHLPIVMLLQVLLADWPVNGWLKLLGMLTVTTAILLPSYHGMVRYTWIGRLLNGPRERG